jgi:hypothetical protein
MKLIWHIDRASFEFSDSSEIDNWESNPAINFEFSPGESDDGGESVFANPDEASKYFALNNANSHFSFTREDSNLIVTAWVRVDEEVIEGLNEEILEEWASEKGGWASCSIDLGEEVEAYITEDDGGDWRVDKNQ